VDRLSVPEINFKGNQQQDLVRLAMHDVVITTHFMSTKQLTLVIINNYEILWADM